MQRQDKITKEWQCKCGEWIDHPGECNDCKRQTNAEIEKALMREG